MPTDETSSFEAFRQKVRDEYYAHKSLNSAGSLKLPEVEKEFRGNLAGCFFIPFLRIIDSIGKRVIKREREKRNYTLFDQQADAILSRSEIKEALRSVFENLPKTEIVTEAVFIEYFITALTDEELREQFDIPLDPVLFAVLGNKIFSKGIRNYCGDVSDEN